MLLTVKEALLYDVNKDTIRVHRSERADVQNGELAKVLVNGRSTLVCVRGAEDALQGFILLDEETRHRLQVNKGERHDFSFSRIGIIQKIRWASRATDPMARIAVGIALWLGLLSVLLGLIGVAVGVWPLLKS